MPHPHHDTGPGNGTDHRMGQQHKEVFAGHRRQGACEKVVAEDHTSSHSAGRKALAGGEAALDCRLSGGHLVDNADPHSEAGDEGGLDAVDGGIVVVEAQGQKVDPMFAFGQDWLKHETVVEIERLGVADAVTYGRQQLVEGRRRVGGVDAQPSASCCAAAGGRRRKAFDGKRPGGKAAVEEEGAVVKCRKVGFD